jgi:hypothetical protein
VHAISDDELNSLLRQGVEKARRIASVTLKDVMKKMGIYGANSFGV